MKRIISAVLFAVLLSNFVACQTQKNGYYAYILKDQIFNYEEQIDEENQTTSIDKQGAGCGEENSACPSQSVGDFDEATQIVVPEVTREPDNEEFVRVVDYIPSARVELAYSTVDNFTGNVIYDFTDVYLRYGTVKKLVNASEELAHYGLGVIIWDGFRPVAAQAKLWEICPDPTFVSHPITGKRNHCRVNTIDVSLYDLESGENLPVPTGYDNFTAFADRDYSDCSADSAANAKLLEQIMINNGFNPYFAEWWHFSDSVDYPVDEYFNPAVPTTWVANCEEFISLRNYPGGAVLTEIPKGTSLNLLGWEGKYAYVSYNGMLGYVMTNYLMPADSSYFSDCLDTVVPTNVYSYEQMVADMEQLELQYADKVHVSSCGTTELGRDIPVICIGNMKARYHVLFQGAVHGREHLTAWLLMSLADYWLDHGILGYGDICYHIIPMSNPDGVIISQTESLNCSQHDIYISDKENGFTSKDVRDYASVWKANGLGVDINRNFPSGWEAINDRTKPSSQGYRGSAPFSSAEARALRDYTLKYSFDATISYHSSGSVIYYEYGDREPVNNLSQNLALSAKEICGYNLVDGNSVDGAGYKDWAIDELGIPSLTLEIGCEDSALAEREIYSVFVRNYRIMPAVARWLQI